MKLILAILTCLMGIYLLRKRVQLNKKVDTESLAEVIEVIPLGISDLQKAYAIKYTIHSSAPFELLVTPTNKKEKLGKTKTIYYEEANPKENYYFKTIKTWDKRLFVPICMIGFSIVLTLGFFIK